MSGTCEGQISTQPRSRRRCAAIVLAALAAVSGVSPAAHAQANLSSQGFGYPPGQLSTSSLAVGGSLGEFDPESGLNPSALASLTRPMIHIQYDPEFRAVTTPSGTDHSTTIRFPSLSAGLPITSRLVLGLSFTTLLDQTWESSQSGLVPVGDTAIIGTQSFKSDGGIEDLQLDAGWTPIPGLRAGLGLHVYTGQNQAEIEENFADTETVKALPFIQTDVYSYVGTGVSVGVDAQPSPLFAIAASAELGGTMRARRNDTLEVKSNIPSRAGVGIRYDGVAGLTLAVRAEWEGWSQMTGLGLPGNTPHDAWDFGGGVEIVGPKVAERGVVLRAGAQTRTLPFTADGEMVRENDLSAGLGIPLGPQRAALDLTVQRALRTAPVLGISEAAWMLSVGLTIRP